MVNLTRKQWNKLGVASQFFTLGLYHGVNVFRGIGSYDIDSDEKFYRIKLSAYRGGYVAGWMLRILVVFYFGVQTDMVGNVTASFETMTGMVSTPVITGLLATIVSYALVGDN